MELLIRWVFCLVAVAAHWANAVSFGFVGFEDPNKPHVPKPGMGLLKPWPPRLVVNQPQVRPPGLVFMPPPTLATPRPPVFAVVKPQKPAVRPTDYPPFHPPPYTIYRPWRVPANTQTQSGQSQNLPQKQPTQLPQQTPPQVPAKVPGQYGAYWVQVPSYLNLGQQKPQVFEPTVAPPATKSPNYPFPQAPGNSYQNLFMRLLSKPTALPGNVVKPRKDVTEKPTQVPVKVYVGQPMNPPPKTQMGGGFVNYGQPMNPPPKTQMGGGFVNYGKPQQVPEPPQDVRGPPLSDFPAYPQYPPYKFVPHVPGYYIYPLYPDNHHNPPPPPYHPLPPHHPLPPFPLPAEKPAYSIKGPPILQKEEKPSFQWSPEGHWIPVFSSE
ncbi:hypothetical protein NL108_015859 [Boleophthalmus pectinirostris]|uniref:uncharacterized protein LOC129408102 n=1 Tax=Boleophthalmus pectinirostris TaxID=150288 RepID=UPI00242D2EC0|nr:uncharacterized protein LOC129408102 [Boleophthalmus pectinirostris]KAJ0059924.1 hypothetical protein NL108_015859 [Boleophthalmus pectinirostris]